MFAFCVVTVDHEYTKPRLTRSVGVKYIDGIYAKFRLKLYFERD